MGLDSFKLRENYVQKLHEYWRNNSNSKYEWDKIINIKQQILNLESDCSKKFYIYKALPDWDDNRFESEILDIKTQKISLINPIYFNDPYDCKIPIQSVKDFLKNQKTVTGKFKLQKSARNAIKEDCVLGAMPKQYRNKTAKKWNLSQQNRNVEEEAKRMIEDFKNDWRVACFTTKPDDMYFWSHYGSTHKGYCIEYSFDNESFNQFMHPVNYKQEFPNFHFKENKCSIALHKSEDWIKEKEWRLLDRIKDQDKDRNEVVRKHPLKGIEISAIYLGLDFSKNPTNIEVAKKINLRREKLLECCKNIDIFQMKLLDNKFGMIPEKIFSNNS